MARLSHNILSRNIYTYYSVIYAQLKRKLAGEEALGKGEKARNLEVPRYYYYYYYYYYYFILLLLLVLVLVLLVLF